MWGVRQKADTLYLYLLVKIERHREKSDIYSCYCDSRLKTCWSVLRSGVQQTKEFRIAPCDGTCMETSWEMSVCLTPSRHIYKYRAWVPKPAQTGPSKMPIQQTN